MKRFRAGLAAVSIVCGLTLTFGAPANAAVDLNACPVLAEGYRGGCVNELQIQLNFVQDPDVDVDGIFGPETAAAVAAFQATHGLEPDGIAGPLTKAALGDEQSVPTPQPGSPLPTTEVELPPGQTVESLSDAELVAKCLGKTAPPSLFKLLRKAKAGSLPETEALIKVNPWLDGAKVFKCILWDNPSPAG